MNQLLQLRESAEALDSNPGLHFIGEWNSKTGLTTPVYLIVVMEDSQYQASVDAMLARRDDSLILMTPTPGRLKAATRELLRLRQSCVLPLAEALDGDETQWWLTDFGKQQMAAFQSSMLPDPNPVNAVAFFPTPPSATWSMLAMSFLDGERVSVTCDSKRHIFNYTQMGMADGRIGKPNKQWELLRSLAVGHGEMTWNSGAAARENQKRKELLSKSLKTFFRIDSDPIPWTKDGSGWVTQFSLKPDR